MHLYLENIGKLSKADIELNGITVIAGENDTGKSTVGKVLFSVFNSCYNIESKIEKERTYSIKHLLNILFLTSEASYMNQFDTLALSKMIIKHKNKYIENPLQLKNDIFKTAAIYDKEFEIYINSDESEQIIKRICDVIAITQKDIFKNILNKRLDKEFYGQINNIYSKEKGIIQLNIKDKGITIELKNDKILLIKNNISLQTESVYIDDPFLLDNININGYSSMEGCNHKEDLCYKMLAPNSKNNIVNEILSNAKLESIYKKISSICNGKIIRNSSKGWSYQVEEEKEIHVKNISTGLKTFVIIKTLLENGMIEENGTIILDEPEIHLHPAWQLVFAEIIVLMQKEFQMHILLNTHSPYFLEAIEVFSDKYGISDKCSYYLAENLENTSVLKNVTTNIELIYKKLARPFQDLENVRFSDDKI